MTEHLYSRIELESFAEDEDRMLWYNTITHIEI